MPTPTLGCIAHLALEAEQTDHEERLVEGPYGYADLFCELWENGERFTIVEWDIAPWFGALAALADCPEPWCAYQYPLHPGGVHADPRDNLHASLGCVKFTPAELGPLPETARLSHWGSLDGNLIPTLRQRAEPHLHYPPVAHARRAD